MPDNVINLTGEKRIPNQRKRDDETNRIIREIQEQTGLSTFLIRVFF